MSFSRVGPNQTIERGQFRLAKSKLGETAVRGQGAPRRPVVHTRQQKEYITPTLGRGDEIK